MANTKKGQGQGQGQGKLSNSNSNSGAAKSKARPLTRQPTSPSPRASLGQGQAQSELAKAGYIDRNRARSKRQPARHPISLQLRNQIMQRDDFRCVFCGAGTAEELQLDHIVPISRGGTNDPHNLQTLCRSCNLSKSNHLG